MHEAPKTLKCHGCGGTMIRGAQMTHLTFQGFDSPTFAMPGFYCETCNEGVVTGRDMRVSDAALEDLKRRATALRAAP